ncbi:MAG: hypothetical protein ABSD29_19640 [Verrucomicrobiota bacterium]|jgi:hypothetical protein
MRNATIRPRFAKYAPLGGIANAAKNIFNGSWTLQHAARRMCVTRECVRQDLAALVGAAQYKRRVKARKARLKQSRQPRTLSTTRAIQFLSHTQEFRFGPAPRFLKYIIKRCLASGLRLALRVCEGRRPILLTPGGRPISVRIVFINGTSRENALGLHRIGISCLRSETHPIAVFLLTTPAITCSYVFRTKDITSVNCIVLRYQALHRPHKYSQALNNWKAIAGS